MGLSLSTKANQNGAAANNRNPVSDSVTLTNAAGTDVKVAKATVMLNYPGYSGVVSTSKDITDVVVPAGGSKTVSSPTFAPSDLKFAGNWHSNLRQGDRYWFDIKVDPADVTTTAGDKVTLTTTPTHEGQTDTTEQFEIKINPTSPTRRRPRARSPAPAARPLCMTTSPSTSTRCRR